MVDYVFSIICSIIFFGLFLAWTKKDWPNFIFKVILFFMFIWGSMDFADRKGWIKGYYTNSEQKTIQEK